MKYQLAKGAIAFSAFLLCLSLLLQQGCAEPQEKKAVYALVDTSGPYRQNFNKVQKVMRYLLGALQTGESLALARIDSESFSEKDIVARITFNLRPSMAVSQKRAFFESMEQFSKGIQPSQYTDITGGILQAIEYLNETRANHKTILIFSDFKEDMKKNQVHDFPINFNGIHVIAIHLIKKQGGNQDLRGYKKRIKAWKERVEQGGGRWKLVSDLERLNDLINFPPND